MSKIIRSNVKHHNNVINYYGVCTCTDCFKIIQKDTNILRSSFFQNALEIGLSKETYMMLYKEFEQLIKHDVNEDPYAFYQRIKGEQSETSNEL